MATEYAQRYGCFTIRKRNRVQTGCPRGLRTGWTEYQVWEGRKIVSRHDYLLAAEQDAQGRLDAFWDEQAKQLEAQRTARLRVESRRAVREATAGMFESTKVVERSAE